jgi:hypothetical protein
MTANTALHRIAARRKFTVGRLAVRFALERQPRTGIKLVHGLNVGGFKMSELEQLEQQVLQLSPEDLIKFRAWVIELDHQLWDKQIEDDVAAGKLDRLMAEARVEFRAGKAREI